MKFGDRVWMKGQIEAGAVVGKWRALLGDTSEYSDDSGTSQGGQKGQTIYNGAAYLNPDPPDDDGTCCEAVMLKGEDDTDVIAFRDLRLHVRVNPSEGECGIAHYGGGFVSLAWDDDHKGTVLAILAPRLDDEGAIDKSHGMIFDPTESNASIQILHLEGSGILLSKDGAVTISAKGGKSTFTIHPDDGIQFATDKGMAFAGGVIAGSTDQAQAVALIQPLIDVVTALVTVLTTGFASLAVPGAAIYVGWPAAIAAPGGLVEKVALLSTLGTATTLKASPT